MPILEVMRAPVANRSRCRRAFTKPTKIWSEANED
jgi:hypothetical protein